MKRLLIFGYTLEVGGAEKAMVDTIKYLNDKCEIDLYLLEKKGDLLKEIPDNVNVYQMRNNLFIYILFRYFSFFRKFFINRIVNRKDYGYVFGYMEGRCGTWVSDIKKNIKKYVWIHNDVMKFDIGISDNEIRKTYNNVDGVICVSRDAKNNFCLKYGVPSDKVRVIYNFIDEKTILKKAREFKVNNKVFTFVNVAKMRDQKRQDRLVEAASYLKNKGYDFKIQLIGDGPNLEKIKKLVVEKNVSDKIDVLGLKLNPYPYVKNADYFVLSSYMEGYGIVIKEALLLKTKVITTDVVGPREILKDGKYGIIVSNDDDALKYVMEDVLINKNKYNYLEKELDNYKGDNEEIKAQTLELLDL